MTTPVGIKPIPLRRFDSYWSTISFQDFFHDKSQKTIILMGGLHESEFESFEDGRVEQEDAIRQMYGHVTQN